MEEGNTTPLRKTACETIRRDLSEQKREAPLAKSLAPSSFAQRLAQKVRPTRGHLGCFHLHGKSNGTHHSI